MHRAAQREGFVQLANHPKSLDFIKELVAEFVNAAVRTAERGSAEGGSPSSLVHLCRMSHRLLLSNENALYEYRLLHTMAFNSSLLVRLWGKILKERQITAYAKNAQPLLSVLARGIRLTAAESASIVPMLVVFAALFGYLLVTIHDTGTLQLHS